MARAAVQRRLSWMVAEVVAVVEETSSVKTLMLRCPGWSGHLPGQHVDIRLTAEDGYQAQRSYSLAAPENGELIELTVELVDDGEVSPYLLEELVAGDRLELRGPIGGYFVWRAGDGKPLLLVGGGSGVVPLMAMLRSRVATGSDEKVRLLLSARSIESVIYRQELERLVEGHEGVEVVTTLTRSRPPGWEGLRRRVDRAMIEDVAWPPTDEPHCYVCGPTGFVEAVASTLVDVGHPPGRIRTERFGPTGGTR